MAALEAGWFCGKGGTVFSPDVIGEDGAVVLTISYKYSERSGILGWI
jgi:hypothetical protein